MTREELRKRIWPSDTFVDFDHGINNAIKRLREALGDTAETPRYVETLPTRGYRFIGKTECDVPNKIRSLAVLPLEDLAHDPGILRTASLKLSSPCWRRSAIYE